MKLLRRLPILTVLTLLVGCSEPVAGSATSPSSEIRPCPTAAQVMKDFMAAFNSGDSLRVARLVGASIHLVDDLPAHKLDSQQREEVLSYLNSRISLGERFQDVVITPGIQANVAGMTFARMASDGRTLTGTGKGVTSASDGASDCHVLSQLIMQSRPSPQP